MRPYSLDLRERVIRALQGGARQKAVAEQFDVSLSTVQRFSYQYRAEGHLRSKPSPGRPAKVTPARETDLLELATGENATLVSIARSWREKTGEHIAASTIHYALRRLGYTHKKNTGRGGT